MPKIVDHDRYRKELLTKSFDLFAEQGYTAITMRQIAQALGVSTGTLYHYFPSKEALFEQLLEALAQQDILTFSAQIKAGETLRDKTNKAFELVEEHRDYFLKQTLIMIEFYQHQQREGKDISDLIRRIYQQTEELMVELFGIDDPNLSIFLMSLTDGLLLQQMYGHVKIDYQAQARLLTEMLELYLEKHKSKQKTP